MAKPLPPAIIETGVVFTPPVRTETTQHGKPISLIETIRNLKVKQSFTIDDCCHEWRARVSAACSYVNKGKKLKVKLRCHKTKEGKLLITRL